MRIEKLSNPVQHYSWGTTDFIPGFLGLENKDKKPFAELWMGDHIRGTSSVIIENEKIPVTDFIKTDPENILGRDTVLSFGKSLPFLFKILSAGSPLSIQAHPNKKQAEEGFKRENERGIPLDAFNRNYRDSNHKPEILCALTPFTAMCGFRESGEIDNLFSITGSDLYKEYLKNSLVSHKDNALRVFFTKYMNLDKVSISRLIKEIIRWARNDNSSEAGLISEFYEIYGDDPGVLAPLFLNVFELQPGEALYQGPGELHAYVRGTGIELMANSDNVLRGGMTSKNVDTGELLNILSFNGGKPKILNAIQESPCIYKYTTEVNEFILKKIIPVNGCPAHVQNRVSVEIFLCTKGKGSIRSDKELVYFSRGDSYIIPAAIPSYTVEGEGECFIASVPETGREVRIR